MIENVIKEDQHLIPSLEALKTSRKTESLLRIKRIDGSIATIKTIVTVPECSQSTIFGIMIDMSEHYRVSELEKQTQEMVLKMKHKSQFVAEIIHEIRTPLNGVIGMTNLALDTNNDVEQKSYIESSLNCAESLLSIVNNILDFTKIEAGKMEVEKISLNLRTVIEETASILAVKADEKDLDIMVHYPTHIPSNIEGDPTRIQQVLMNLVGNAIKFTTQGHILISVTVTSNNIQVNVSDTGIGIPHSQINNIFNTFQQASSSTSRIYGGTGLGLSISKHLVSLMGGEIGVRSFLGKGSDFWFTLPSSSISSLLRHIPTKISTTTFPLKTSQKVLVVDPNPKMAKIIEEQLRHWGLSN